MGSYKIELGLGLIVLLTSFIARGFHSVAKVKIHSEHCIPIRWKWWCSQISSSLQHRMYNLLNLLQVFFVQKCIKEISFEEEKRIVQPSASKARPILYPVNIRLTMYKSLMFNETLEYHTIKQYSQTCFPTLRILVFVWTEEIIENFHLTYSSHSNHCH